MTDLHQNWRPLIPGMADAYLRWKYGCGIDVALTKPLPPLPTTRVTEVDSPPPIHSADSDLEHVIPPDAIPANPAPADISTTDGASGGASAGDADSPANDDPANDTPIASACTNPTPPCPNDSARGHGPPLPNVDLEIAAIDIYTLSTSIKVRISSTGEDTTASALAELGFVGNVPLKPTVAVSIKTLDLYRVLRRRKPSFSVEAFVKVISDLYLVCPIFNTTYPTFTFKTDPIPSQVSPCVRRCL